MTAAARRLFQIVRDPDGHDVMEVDLTGIALLRLVLVNKGTAFSYDERAELELEGLLPPQVNTFEQQLDRAYRGYSAEPTPLAKYQFLRALQDRQEILYYGLLDRHLDEMLPIVYTPTVGLAVQQFSALYQTPRGLSLSPLNIDRAAALVASYPLDDVRMIVATDSSAILGIGDQGYGGLAIPIGKLALYTAAGGVSPFHTMPVALDVGTDREDLLADPFYLGVRQKRLRGDAYLEFIDRFVAAIRSRWPHAVIQWEDLAKDTAFTVLDRHLGTPSFNDDIQGTGAVALAGMLRACTLRGERLRDQRVVIHGAGAGGIGVATAIRNGMLADGASEAEAHARVLVLDSRGLLVDDRPMDDYKRSVRAARGEGRRLGRQRSAHGGREVARDRAPGAVGSGRRVRRTGRARAGAQHHATDSYSRCRTRPRRARPRPPTSWRGPTATRWSRPGRRSIRCASTVARAASARAITPSCSPVWARARVLARARVITDGMVTAAAHAVASYTTMLHPDEIYPPVAELPAVSRVVTAAVVARAAADGVAGAHPDDVAIAQATWRPQYLPISAARVADRDQPLVTLAAQRAQK